MNLCRVEAYQYISIDIIAYVRLSIYRYVWYDMAGQRPSYVIDISADAMRQQLSCARVVRPGGMMANATDSPPICSRSALRQAV